MLIAAITALYLLLGSGGEVSWTLLWIEGAQSAAPDHIEDEARLAEVLGVLAEMKSEAEGFRSRVGELRRDLVRVDAEYGSTRADFNAVFERLDDEWARAFDRLIDLRFELRDHVHRDEWVGFIQAADAAAELPAPSGG